MKVLIDIGHPAHVHFFRNVISNLRDRGHEVKITARDKEVTLSLLKYYGLPFEVRGEMQYGLMSKAFGLIKTDLRLFRIARSFKPDLLLGVGNPYVAHVGTLLRKPSIIFTDTEHVHTSNLLTYPFASTIITPECFREPIDPKKHLRIRGFKEVAYLHPSYFSPDPSVLAEAGILPGERFIILRFISWGASHDTMLRGVAKEDEASFIRSLSEYGKVLITSEKPLGGDLEKHRIRIGPEKMHSLLSYADLYVGEGGTMAAEAAFLGIPSIHIESTADGRASGELSGNFLELRNRYNLMFFYATPEEALQKAKEILGDGNSKAIWKERKDRLFRDVIDVTSWLTEYLERYPDTSSRSAARPATLS